MNENVHTTDPSKKFEILEKLGEGSYGAVYKAKDRETEALAAIKIVPVEKELDELMNEIKILKKCDSQYVTKYFGSYLKGDNIWIAMEFCGGGSVNDLMVSSCKTLNEDEK